MTQYYPSHTRYFQNSNHYLWFSVQPKELKYSGTLESDSQNIGINAEKVGERRMFLAPMEFQDNITHNWEPMENILSRIQEKAATARRELFMSSQQHKVDTALLYQDTNRREISFTVYLGVYNSPYNDVMKPINDLRALSSPELGERTTTQTKVGNPHIFKLDTVTGAGKIVSLINIRNAALTAVQPNFQGPFLEGIPSYCELTLTFKDMEPLSKESFEQEQSRVSVGR